MEIELRKLVSKMSKEKGFSMVGKTSDENVLSFIRDNYNLQVDLEHISVQVTISLKEDTVLCLVFPHPIIVNGNNKDVLIKLINLINYYIQGYGHFYIDDYDDIAYKVVLPKYLFLEHIEEVENQMFDTPIQYYESTQIPLIMLANDKWNLDKATQFITEMFENGYVFNNDYEI